MQYENCRIPSRDAVNTCDNILISDQHRREETVVVGLASVRAIVDQEDVRDDAPDIAAHDNVENFSPSDCHSVTPGIAQRLNGTVGYAVVDRRRSQDTGLPSANELAGTSDSSDETDRTLIDNPVYDYETYGSE